MERETALAWMAIQRLPGARTAPLRRVLQQTPDPNDLLAAPDSALRGSGLTPEWLAARHRHLGDAQWRDQRERELDQLLAQGVTLLAARNPDWPALLSEIPDPPYLLYVRGNPALLNRPQIAIVGSRKASRQGIDNARAFAAALATAGMAVTSGLALGIDAAAHAGALAADGDTVAVIGTGIDITYPRNNRQLTDKIAEHGAIVTELPPGTQPTPEQFPQRNRIISGLSIGVLVVEAALRSGSLITARLALEQNREVFAIPGSIHSVTSRGCNALLQNGAKLVTSVADIVEEFGGWAVPASAEPAVVGGIADTVLNALGFEPESLDGLQSALGLPVAELLPLLTELQLQGRVESVGGCWQRCR